MGEKRNQGREGRRRKGKLRREVGLGGTGKSGNYGRGKLLEVV